MGQRYRGRGVLHSPMRTRALLLVNPGARRGSERLAEVQACLPGLGLEVITGELGEPGAVGELIRRHLGAIDRVVVAGGDGTLHTVVQGLVGTKLPLGIIPLGTANNLA